MTTLKEHQAAAGRARMAKLTPEQRQELARKGVLARKAKGCKTKPKCAPEPPQPEPEEGFSTQWQR